MAYIPPHKRHSKEAGDSNNRLSPPIPQSLAHQFRRKFSLRPSRAKSIVERSGKIIYAEQAISRWFAVGLDDNNQFPSSVHVDHVSLESIGRKTEGKPLALFNNNKSHSDEEMKRPWEVIAENAVVDLVSCFENVRDEKLEGVKPTLVARFGKILFRESPSISQETRKEFLAAETTLSQLKRSFYTNVPNSYMENVLGEVVQKIEVDFEEEKDLYHVKTELNQVRHMVVDVSCLDKNVDLRLMLSTKRVLTALTDDEMQSIRSLINSAILDQDVKGGLRWPFGKASSGDRYCVNFKWGSYKGDNSEVEKRCLIITGK
uniref:DUF7903 domain-containing protein n=1 Tax=Fagus sylvatica TaxID=28930 RepID=A0A2N9EL16_FAGSY